jgi:hypothetical protein
LENLMWTDPIIEELHRVRQAHAARFRNDLKAIAADLQRIERDWPGEKLDPAPRPPLRHPASDAAGYHGASTIKR